MKFTVQDAQNHTLFTGTKQECIRFAKRKKLNKQEITLEKFDDTPAPHYTIPITAEEDIPESFFNKIFD